ncbi:MAG: transposon-encoded TnpW family protein [Lachnospiraceae bacterium]|nr:transposon-encoded TnpW family protein [Lachnospiraceae bacterium]
MNLLSKLHSFINKIRAIWRDRRGEYSPAADGETNDCTYTEVYHRKIGDTTFLVSAVFSSTAAETVIDRISRLLDSKTRYE